MSGRARSPWGAVCANCVEEATPLLPTRYRGRTVNLCGRCARNCLTEDPRADATIRELLVIHVQRVATLPLVGHVPRKARLDELERRLR